MKQSFFLLAFVCISTFANAQGPDYHFPFDGNAQDAGPNHATVLTGDESNRKYGPDRNGAPASAVYNTGSAYHLFIPYKLELNTTAITFWYKSSTNLDEIGTEASPKSIFFVLDTGFFAPLFKVTTYRNEQNAIIEFTYGLDADAGVIPISINTNWNHIAFSWVIEPNNTYTIKGYKNGILLTTLTDIKRNTMLSVHAIITDLTAYNCMIDDLRYYNRGLSDTEVNEMGGGANSVSEERMMAQPTPVPNPATDVLSLVIDEAGSDAVVTITDQTGRIVLQTPYSPSINVSELAQGVYAVRIATATRQVGSAVFQKAK